MGREVGLHFLHAHELKSVSWRNGGGITNEIAIHSDLLIHPDFLWRLSIATVDKPGPFSLFEGVDRTIAVIEGEGIVISDALDSHSLTRTSAPYTFAGEKQIRSSMIAGRTSDLNAMTRRSCFVHSMERLVLRQSFVLETKGDKTFIVFNDEIIVKTEAFQYFCKRFDVLCEVPEGEIVELIPEHQAEVLIVSISGVRA